MGNVWFLVVAYDEISKLCRVYRGNESSCLTYCNFLKYDKSVIKDCLLSYLIVKRTVPVTILHYQIIFWLLDPL